MYTHSHNRMLEMWKNVVGLLCEVNHEM